MPSQATSLRNTLMKYCRCSCVYVCLCVYMYCVYMLLVQTPIHNHRHHAKTGYMSDEVTDEGLQNDVYMYFYVHIDICMHVCVYIV